MISNDILLPSVFGWSMDDFVLLSILGFFGSGFFYLYLIFFTLLVNTVDSNLVDIFDAEICIYFYFSTF